MNALRWLFPPVLLLIAGLTGRLPADPIHNEPSELVLANRRIERGLRKEFDPREIKGSLTLKGALRILRDKTGDTDFPFVVDSEAFKEENPDAPNVYDTQVIFPPYPKRLTVAAGLRSALVRANPPNATFLVRAGTVEITTIARVSPERLLRAEVSAIFSRCPLDLALEELSAQTGATIVVDGRGADKAQTPVSARFLRTIPLETAVRLLAEMADLTVRNEDDVLFVTLPRKKGKGLATATFRFKGRPLDMALRDIAQRTGVKIVVDPKALLRNDPRSKLVGWTGVWGPLEGNLVTATIEDKVSGRTAAKVVAALAGLTVVDVDDVLLVTTREKAREIEGDRREVSPSKRPRSCGGTFSRRSDAGRHQTSEVSKTSAVYASKHRAHAK